MSNESRSSISVRGNFRVAVGGHVGIRGRDFLRHHGQEVTGATSFGGRRKLTHISIMDHGGGGDTKAPSPPPRKEARQKLTLVLPEDTDCNDPGPDGDHLTDDDVELTLQDGGDDDHDSGDEVQNRVIEHKPPCSRRRPLSAGAMSAPIQPTVESPQPQKSNEDTARAATRAAAANATRRRQRTLSLSGTSTVSTEREPILRTKQRTIYTAGRPPWYNQQGRIEDTFVIGICGGSASGKTTVAQKIIQRLGVPWVTLLSMDSFYKVLSPEQHELAAVNEYNFDNPDAFDFDLLVRTLKRLRQGKKVEVPIYNFVTHRRESKTRYSSSTITFLTQLLAYTMVSFF